MMQLFSQIIVLSLKLLNPFWNYFYVIEAEIEVFQLQMHNYSINVACIVVPQTISNLIKVEQILHTLQLTVVDRQSLNANGHLVQFLEVKKHLDHVQIFIQRAVLQIGWFVNDESAYLWLKEWKCVVVDYIMGDKGECRKGVENLKIYEFDLDVVEIYKNNGIYSFKISYIGQIICSNTDFNQFNLYMMLQVIQKINLLQYKISLQTHQCHMLLKIYQLSHGCAKIVKM
ncbi:Hypothetical_protein [Hexamita inflata]|uniref:Hypothetical_protein n=1 Tax=Hexamita inflata TaxID=28002 RepID=A0AA86U0H2_9EUKA|nr:Hypothetical protein HINF_LOCUS21467 [Hexamita inflata]